MRRGEERRAARGPVLSVLLARKCVRGRQPRCHGAAVIRIRMRMALVVDGITF